MLQKHLSMKLIINNNQNYFLISAALHVTIAVLLLLLNEKKSVIPHYIDFTVSIPKHSTQSIVDHKNINLKRAKSIYFNSNQIDQEKNTIKQNSNILNQEDFDKSTRSQNTIVKTTNSEQLSNNEASVISDLASTDENNARSSAYSVEEKYVSQVRKIIMQNKYYPLIAKKMNLTGQVRVQFKLQSNGEIVDLKLIENSKHTILNDSALHIFKTIKKFNEFPTEIKKEIWTFIVPIDFKM